MLYAALRLVAMDWPAGREMDLAFGPRFPNEYDFTLRFEHLILTIVPSLLFTLIAVWYMWHLRGRAACNRSGGLSWIKLVRFCICHSLTLFLE